MRALTGLTCGILAALAVGCAGDGTSDGAATLASAQGGYDPPVSAEELERGRSDPGWRRVVQIDSATWSDSTGENPESWDAISAQAVNSGPVHLPLSHVGAGPSVLRVQILLDRALFSPGIMDGRWGKNTEKAVYWLQKREGIAATGRVDKQTFDRLVQLAGNPSQLVVRHRLTEDDVAGPFVEIPASIYEKAKLKCLCYESLAENLAETFHTSPELLRQLNPRKELNSLRAGDEIDVPKVRDEGAGRDTGVARIVVSDVGHFVHALDANGRLLFHFPSTLGSTYDPSPEGKFRVTSVTEDPWWHYQPDLLAHVNSSEPDAKIPPGPNNAVGLVWMALSKPHYGIHGTSAPETIGYASSAGCVRLTNWDALFLARRIGSGVPVQFHDT